MSGPLYLDNNRDDIATPINKRLPFQMECNPIEVHEVLYSELEFCSTN